MLFYFRHNIDADCDEAASPTTATTTATTTSAAATAATSTSLSSPLAMNCHAQVIKFLSRLTNPELIAVGVLLGLRYPNLKRMSSESLLTDMVYSWLRRDDDVIEAGTPSWNSLIEALMVNGKTGIASDIKKVCPIMIVVCLFTIAFFYIRK